MAPMLCPGSVGIALAMALLGDRHACGHFHGQDPGQTPGASVMPVQSCVAPAPEGCSLGLRKGKAWPGDSQWTGRGQGPQSLWGAGGPPGASLQASSHRDTSFRSRCHWGAWKDNPTQQAQGEGARVGGHPSPRSPTLQGRSLGDELGLSGCQASVWPVQTSASSQGGSQGAGFALPRGHMQLTGQDIQQSWRHFTSDVEGWGSIMMSPPAPSMLPPESPTVAQEGDSGRFRSAPEGRQSGRPGKPRHCEFAGQKPWRGGSLGVCRAQINPCM